MCLPNILSPVFMFAFIFHCRSFSPCWPIAFLIVSQPLWIFLFFFLQNSSLLFSIIRSTSFSVIHVSVNIKNNVEKDTTLLLFFLSKRQGGQAISFQIHPWVAFGLPYLLIELFYIGVPVVRTDGRAGGRSVYGHVILGWVVYHIFLPMVLRCARFARQSSAIKHSIIHINRYLEKEMNVVFYHHPNTIFIIFSSFCAFLLCIPCIFFLLFRDL